MEFKYDQKDTDIKKLQSISYSDLDVGDLVYIRFNHLPDNISRIMLQLNIINNRRRFRKFRVLF